MGIGVDLLVVLWAAAHVAALLGPVLPAVLRAEEAALVAGGLHDRVHHVRIDGGYREADAALVSLGKPLVDLAPGGSRIGGLVDARLRSAVEQHPHVPASLVGGRVQHVGVARVEVYVGHSGVLADREHLLPRLPAVGGLVQSAVAAGRPQGALGRHVHHVRVARVDEDLGDVLRVLEPHLLEAAPAVERLVQTVAVPDAALAVVLPRADPHYEAVVGIDRHRADGVGAVLVEDRLPRGARVLRLPHVAGGRGYVPRAAPHRVHRDVDYAPRHERGPDAPEFEPRDQRRVELGWLVIVVVVVLCEDRSGDRARDRECEQEQEDLLHRPLPCGRPDGRASSRPGRRVARDPDRNPETSTLSLRC